MFTGIAILGHNRVSRATVAIVAALHNDRRRRARDVGAKLRPYINREVGTDLEATEFATGAMEPRGRSSIAKRYGNIQSKWHGENYRSY